MLAGVGEQRARGLGGGAGDEDVARAGGEEVGDVEAAAAPLEARDPLLEQDPLDQLGLGEVAAKPTLTGSPPVYWGFTLRALSWASVIGSCSPRPT